jgi:hypothetical protein
MPWRPFLWTLAILCVAYLPLFLGQILFFRDVAHWSFPARAFLRESLLRGELPTWNPYQGLGFSVLADPLYGILYPPNWLFLLVGQDWVAPLVNWQCFLHTAWGALAICVLARRLGASPKAVTVAGLAWALSGYVTSQWSSGLLLLADAWVPWAAVGQMALLDRLRRGGDAWKTGVVLAALPTVFACLLGEIFLAMIGAAFGMVFAGVIHAAERRQDPSLPGARLTWVMASVAAIVIGFGAGAVVIVPAGVLLGSTERAASLSRDLAEMCSLHPLRALEFVAPQSMGDAYTIFPAAPIVGEARLDSLPLSYSMYVGASVVGLVLASFARGRRIALSLALLAAAALLLAFGRYTPIHGLFRQVVLPLSYMRYPEKYTIVVVTVIALLASLGTDRLFSGAAQPWRRIVVLAMVLAGFAVAAASVVPGAWATFAIHGAMMGTIALLALFAVQFLAARGSRLAPPVLLALVALDLALAAWPLQTFGPRALAVAPPLAQKLLDGRPTSAPPPRIYRSHQSDDTLNHWLPTTTNAQTEFKLAQTLITNTANAWGIATLPGYDAAIPSLVDEVWNRGLDVGQDVLRLLGAEYAILPVEKPDAPDERDGLQPLLDPLPGARLYRVPDTLPRVYWAAHAEVATDKDAMARIFQPDVVAGRTVLLSPEGNLAPLTQAPGRAGTCALESYTNQRVVATCTGEQAGIAVLVEQFAPGWRATLDGQAIGIARANLFMRALPLAPGTHHIVIEYRPPGLVTGALISAACLMLLLVLLFSIRRARPSRR